MAPGAPEPKQAYPGLVAEYTAIYYGVGAILSGASPVAGAIVMDKAPDRARELVNACKNSPKAIALLKRFTKSNNIMTAIAGHGMMLLAILVAVDRIPLSQRTGAVLAATGYEQVVMAKVAEQQQQQQGAQYGAPVAA